MRSGANEVPLKDYATGQYPNEYGDPSPAGPDIPPKYFQPYNIKLSGFGVETFAVCNSEEGSVEEIWMDLFQLSDHTPCKLSGMSPHI